MPRTFTRLCQHEGKGDTSRRLNNVLLLAPIRNGYLSKFGDFSRDVMAALMFESTFMNLKKTMSTRTWPTTLTPAVHTFPSLPTRTVWFLPQAAWTNLVPAGEPKSTGLIIRGSFSEMWSLPVTPRHDDPFLPKSQAFPWMSMTTKWQPLQDVCTETARTFSSERRRCGSSKSGFLFPCEQHAHERMNNRVRRTQPLRSRSLDHGPCAQV